MSNNCPNMNHGRLVAQISFCPTCGVNLNNKIAKRCDSVVHAARRKDRSVFCSDCGLKLSSAPVRN